MEVVEGVYRTGLVDWGTDCEHTPPEHTGISPAMILCDWYLIAHKHLQREILQNHIKNN